MKDLFIVLIFLQLLLLIDRDLSTDRDWSLLDAAQSSDLMAFIGELASPLLAIAPSREPPHPTNRTKQKALFCSGSSSSWGSFEGCSPCWMCVIANINVTCKDIFVWEFIELLLKPVRSAESINMWYYSVKTWFMIEKLHKQSIQPEFHL